VGGSRLATAQAGGTPSDRSRGRGYVSAASIWEAAIKARLGKLAADPHELAAAIEPSGFIELPVRASHAAGVGALELHHNDPFDRLLLAQALAEPLRLVTSDAVLAQYSELVILV
jgi:PIN domain nuclease of toxin-antitoxin system